MLPLLAFKKAIVPHGPHDFDALLDDRYIGSFRSHVEAQAELDRVAYEQARRLPVGLSGGLAPTISLTDDALDRAFEVLIGCYSHSPAIVSRAERALEVAKNRDRFTIRADGSVTVHGRQRYQVTDDGCTCKDVAVRDAVHAGLCNHMLAREIWRLAQERATTGHPNDDPPTPQAFCTVPSIALGRALDRTHARAGAAHAVTLRITNRLLTLSVCGAASAQLVGDDGYGSRALALSNEAFTALCAEYVVSLELRHSKPPPMQLRIDHVTKTVALTLTCVHRVAGTPASEDV